MTSIIKVDQIQTAAGSVPTSGDLGLNVSGTVLQVIHANNATTVSNATTSFIDTGTQATITPSSTSSKILILLEQHTRYQTNYDQGVGFKIFRGNTAIFTSTTSYDEYNYDGDTTTSFDSRGRRSLQWFDSPNTTSATTYKVQAALYRGDYGPVMKFQDSGNYSFITLMEIAG